MPVSTFSKQIYANKNAPQMIYIIYNILAPIFTNILGIATNFSNSPHPTKSPLRNDGLAFHPRTSAP